MHIISTDPIFCAISHIGTITLQYFAYDHDDDGGGGDDYGDEIYVFLLFQAVVEVSCETLQVLPTYVRTF